MSAVAVDEPGDMPVTGERADKVLAHAAGDYAIAADALETAVERHALLSQQLIDAAREVEACRRDLAAARRLLMEAVEGPQPRLRVLGP